MPLQNSACSRDALAGSVSSSIPTESSPPRVAATMSGLSEGTAPESMRRYYTDGRKKFSNSRWTLGPYGARCGVEASADTGPGSARGRGHRDRALGRRPSLDEHL